TISQSLLRSSGSALYRAVRNADRRPVLLEVGSPAQEYELARGLSARCILRPIARTTYDGLPTLVLEDFDGVSLRSLIGEPMRLGLFLRIAVELANALYELHEDGVIHKDIKPDTILVNPRTAAVKIVGLGIATCIPRQAQVTPIARLIQGSLPYMS